MVRSNTTASSPSASLDAQPPFGRASQVAASAAPAFIRGHAARRLMIFGEPMLFHLTGKETAGGLFFFEQEAAPGYGVPSHVHEREDEIFHVLEGQVRFAVGSGADRQEFIATSGDTVWGPRGVAHEWEVVGTSRARLHFVTNPSGMEHMFEELDRLPPGKPDFGKVAEICGRYGIRFG